MPKTWNTGRKPITINDVELIDKFNNLLQSRNYLRKSMDLLIEAEAACPPEAYETRYEIYKTRKEVLIVWQEVENEIEIMFDE